MQKRWDEHSIKALLKSNKNARYSALLKIYNNQTEDEKLSSNTESLNDIGFTAFDSVILTSFAEQLIKIGSLTEKQDEILKSKITKYWRQLLEIIRIKNKGRIVKNYKSYVVVADQKLL